MMYEKYLLKYDSVAIFGIFSHFKPKNGHCPGFRPCDQMIFKTISKSGQKPKEQRIE